MIEPTGHSAIWLLILMLLAAAAATSGCSVPEAEKAPSTSTPSISPNTWRTIEPITPSQVPQGSPQTPQTPSQEPTPSASPQKTSETKGVYSSKSKKETVLAIAQTIYGEEHARLKQYDYKGDAYDWKGGQIAVMYTIINRYNNPKWPQDIYKIATSTQFGGYKGGKNAYESGDYDEESFTHACILAEKVMDGSYTDISMPNGMTEKHVQFRKATAQNEHISGRFGEVQVGGNRFFWEESNWR